MHSPYGKAQHRKFGRRKVTSGFIHKPRLNHGPKMSGRARSVYVRGLPELSGLQDKVSGYFQSGSLSAGGAVTRVKLLGAGQALVTFVDETVAKNVLAQPQHTLHGTRIKVTACPPHLDVPEESVEDTEETEKGAADKTEEGKKDTLLSEEERKVGQAEVEASQQESIKNLPLTANEPGDDSSDSDYATPPESPTPKRLPVRVCHESKIDEREPVIVNSLLVQKQANADSSDSGATSQHVLQQMAGCYLFKSLTEPSQSEDDSPRKTGPPAPPKFLPKPPKPTVPKKPSPKPTTSSTAHKETTATFPQHLNTEGERMADKEQERHPTTMFSTPGTAPPSPLYPNLPNTSMGGHRPQPQHQPFYHWTPPPVRTMSPARPPLYPFQLPGSHAHFMPQGVGMPYGDPRHGFPWIGRGGIPPAGVPFQGQRHPASGPQSSFFPQASPPTTGGPYMSSGQPASNIPLTTARSSPSSEVLYPYHQQPSSSQSPSWGSPRTGSPVSLPLLQQDRNRGRDYLPDQLQASSVHSRQTPTDLMSVCSDGESTFVDASDSFSKVGSIVSDADSCVTSRGRKETTRPLGAAAKTDHHLSYRQEAKLKYKAPYTMPLGASKTHGQAKKPFVEPSRSIVVSGFTSAPDVDFLWLYFESKRRSGGGGVDEEIKVRGTDEVIITFKDPAVTQRVLARKHVLNGQILNVKEFTSSSEEASPDTDTSPPQNITIQVSGFTSSPNKEMMMLYFENKKRSGGGEIQDIQVRDNKVFIVFKDPSVGRHVLSCEHRLDETVLKLKEVQPRSLDNTRLLVKGFKKSTTKETLGLYLENVGDDEVTTIDYSTQPGVALVTFNRISNFDRMVTKAQSRPLEGQQLTMERVPVTDAIIVTGLPDNVSRDLLELYFERETGNSGGSVTEIKMDSSTGTAVVQFDDTNTVNSVHRKSTHILNNTPIRVQPYYECLGEVVDDNAPGAFQLPQPFDVKIKPKLVLFAFAMFAEQLKSELADIYAEVDLLVTDMVTVSPTLTPKMKGVRKLAKHWEDESRRCVEQFFTQFQATEIPVAAQIWQRAEDRFEEASEKVSTSNRDDVWIEASDEEDGGGVVTLIGTTEAVMEAELACKTIIKETEALLKWEASILTDHIANVKAAKLKILQLNNFTGKHPLVEIRLNVDNRSVDFKGQQVLVQKAKIDLYETTNKMAEERVTLSCEKLAYLKSDKGMKHLEDSLKKNDIKAAFAIENEEMAILAQLFVEVLAAKDLLQQVVSESPVAIAEESRDLLTKQGFVTYSKKLQQQLSVDIHIKKDRSIVWVVGPVEKVATAAKDIKTYLATNTIVTINMDVAKGKTKYLDYYRSAAIKDVEKNHAEQLVKIMIGQGKLTVRGTKDGTKSAMKQLQALIDVVTTGTMNITKPGMHKFFTKGSGRGLLKGIEREVKCVIQAGGKSGVPVRDMGGARAGAAPGGPKQICYHTMGGRNLVVVQGDLTSHHRVDVMVNTANGSLSHGGGLAAAIVRAGGQEIQRDCNNYIKDNGKLTEGQVMSTKGYRLPCKMVVHAVGPLWIADEKDSKEKVLKMAVENALLAARDYHSIAIPAISAGNSGYPIKPCVAAIVAAVTAFFNTNPDCALSEVHFVEMDPQKTDAFRDELLSRFGRDKVMMTGTSDTTPSGLVPTPRPRVALDAAADAATSPSNSLTSPEGINIQLKKGDITAEKADVLVNTTSGDLDLSRGGVARAFGQAGGQELQQLCNNHGKANAGDIVITQPAGTLRCKQVYHAVLPNWQESDQPLRTMVQDCLAFADEDGYTSIAFPAMGTGNLKYPRDVAVSCMYDEILSFSQDNPGTTLQDVRIIVFDQPTVQAFETELRVRQGVPGASGTASGSGSNPAVTTPMPGQQQMTIGNVTLQIQGGDLTTENVDCVVNVTSKDLDLSGPMAKAICQKAGSTVAAECQQYITRNGQQDHGAVVLTGAGNLPYKGILHLTHPNTKVLKKSIKTCLKMAEKRGFRSIAFPAVGTGGFAISSDQAASLMLDGVTDFAQKGSPQSLTTVRITVFQQQMLQNFHSEMDRRARDWGHKSGGFSAKVESRFKKVSHSLGKKSRVAKILGFSLSDGKRSVGDTTTATTSLLLHFYGTDRAVGVAKRRVQETVDENFKEEKIDNAAVLQLSSDEVDMLKAYGQQNSVSIIVDQVQGGRHCITIQGIFDVASVMSKVWEVLHAKMEESRKMEQALSLQKDLSWCYEQPDGTYVPFDPLINLQIEEAYKKNKKGKVQYEDDVGQCEIDFSTMKEKASGQVSNVRRDDLKACAVTSAVPSHWDPQPNDPKSGKPILCHLVIVKSSSAEYNTVSGKFGLGNIVSIERVQNPTLWSQYCAQKQKISLKNPGINIDQDLWHGSSADSCVKIYHNGFNRSYAGVHGTAIGKGTYFAVSPSYPADRGFASLDASGHKRMFLAKVLTGLSTPGNSSMIVPPPRPGGGPLDTYDSTTDGASMFCVFHDAQAYPEYLITFT
ncbi:protein mono-ADP-ribosyltransferase PARP14-like [Branchiostoma floridae x Branchiostoma japonicum]